MQQANEVVSALRTAIARLDSGAGSRMAAEPIPVGVASLDGRLGGGLRRAALHEIYPADGLNDAAASGGFGLGLALRAGGTRPLVWIRQDVVDAEIGRPHGVGLAAFGADPDRLILVRAANQIGGLQAAREALRCPPVGAVLLEFWGASRALDLTATRRLALAAGQSGVTLFTIRLGACPAPSAATTRWSVAAAASIPLEANAPGRPAFAITLLRHRAGLPGRTWHVEWDCDRVSFVDPAPPLSRPVVSVPPRRAAAADHHPGWRLAG